VSDGQGRGRGELLLYGPVEPVTSSGQGPDASRWSPPAHWAGLTIKVLLPPELTAAAGAEPAVAAALGHLAPWSADVETLPVAADEGLAALATRAVAAASNGDKVLVLLPEPPWVHPLGRALVAAALGRTRQPGERPAFSFSVVDRSAGAVSVSAMPLDRLGALMRRLLGPGGCPWDREQTHQSLAPYLVEEAAEVLEAIERRELHRLPDELGDLLLQIAFHAALEEAEGRFDLSDVCRAIEDKMLHRHPHVFAGWRVADAREVLVNWELLKSDKTAATGAPGEGRPWCRLRKKASMAALAAFELAFATAQGSWARSRAARAELERAVAALAQDAEGAMGGAASPREEEQST
jgi:NTP pyrophosphatase (non-canonical NTP hydrolase)